MIAKIIEVPEHITQKTFLEYMKDIHGINGIRLTKSNLYEIRSIIMHMDDYAMRWSNYMELCNDAVRMMGKGCADFLLYTDKELLFCEFKSKGDTLTIDQILWFERFSKFPLGIAVAKGHDSPSFVQENGEKPAEEKANLA